MPKVMPLTPLKNQLQHRNIVFFFMFFFIFFSYCCFTFWGSSASGRALMGIRFGLQLSRIPKAVQNKRSILVGVH